MGSFIRFIAVAVLIVSLMGAEMRVLFCHGRRIPGSEVAIMALAHDDVESPPLPREGQGHHSPSSSSSSSSKHGRQRPRWRRAQQDLSESKRTVPSGPNPLHN